MFLYRDPATTRRANSIEQASLVTSIALSPSWAILGIDSSSSYYRAGGSNSISRDIIAHDIHEIVDSNHQRLNRFSTLGLMVAIESGDTQMAEAFLDG